MNESLIKAQHDAAFLCDDLREVYSKGDPLLSAAVAPLMEEAAQLRNRLEALSEADQAEQQRRDEKHGLYAEHEDIAN